MSSHSHGPIAREEPITEAVPRDPWLLIPGPLTTAGSTTRAMLHEWGSRDSAFYQPLQQSPYVIYPGQLTVTDSFRVGCIGSRGEAAMRAALGAPGVEPCAPRPERPKAGTRVGAGAPR